jgi:hypothetical protein
MGKTIGKYTVYLVWLAIVILPGVYGWDYYTTPLQEQPFMEQHELLKPTGLIGHGYGIIGSLFMMIGVSTYSIRKRFPALQRLGKLSHWLQFHIFLCTTGPALVFWHTSMKFGGIVSISFWSMVIVVASGVLGRYVYNRIPKTEDGYFKNVESIVVEKKAIWERIQERISLDAVQLDALGLKIAAPDVSSVGSALFSTLRHDVTSFTSRGKDLELISTHNLDQETSVEVLSLVREYRWKIRQQYLLEPLQKIFGYWHVFHIPLATIMFIILAVHVAVAIVFGYTWIF